MAAFTRGPKLVTALAFVFTAVVAGSGKTGAAGVAGRGAASPIAERSSTVRLMACSNASGSISPCTSSTSLPSNTTGSLYIFTINNTSSSYLEGGITCAASGKASGCAIYNNAYGLNGHTSMTDTISYDVGTPGTGSVTASTGGQIGVLTSTLTVTVTPPSYADSVFPKNLVQPAVGLATNTVYFTLTNTGANSATFNVTTACVAPASACALTTSSSVTLASGAATYPTVTYTAGAVGTTGKVKLAATYANNSAITDTGYFNDSAVVSVAVTPDNGLDTLPASTASSYTFHLSNVLRPVATTYNLTATCVSPATACSAPSSITMAPNASDSVVYVSFTSGAAGTTGTVKLMATQSTDGANKDSGWVQVTAAPATLCSNSLASITPCTPTASLRTNYAGAQTFTLKNLLNSDPESFSYSCTVSGQIAPGSCGVTGPGSLAPLATGSVVANYTTGGKVGGGAVVLTIINTGTSLTVPITVTVVAPPPMTALHRLVLTPHYQALEEDISQIDTVVYTVRNAGTDTGTFRATRRCSGSGVSSCVSAADSVFLKPDSIGTLRLIFTMAATAGFTGRDSLFVQQTADPTVRDSASLDLTVNANAPGVSTSQLNPGSTVDRNLCLTIAAGAGAGVECGDLRLVHVFPGVRTYNKARNPTLIYSSATAHPFVTIRADETLPASGIPTAISAALLGSAGDTLAAGSWTPSQWAARSTRRIALTYDASAKSTGIYTYTFAVKRTYATDSVRQDNTTGEFVVVNRKASPFGPGWWVAGFEQLLTPGSATMLWVGGDGSARKYSQVNDSTWGATNVSYPDSIKKRGTNFERILPRRLIVRFNSVGQHVATVNRLRQSTSFHEQATTGLLDMITVAPTSAGMIFTFNYDTVANQPRLRRVLAPSVNSQSRYDSLRYNASNQVTTFRRVDGTTANFTYDASVTNRIVSRTNELGFTTSYGYNAASLVTTITAPLDASTNAVTAITPWETRGLNGTSALSSDAAYAILDGPRTDVGDSTLLWLDRFGAPRRVRNALGDETSLTRDASWPALVARMRSPMGQVLTATYDSRGNILSSTDSASYDPALHRYATTAYRWQPGWDLLTKITNPDSDSVRFAYDTATGNKIWQQDGLGHQTNFRYYDSTIAVVGRLPRASQIPTGESDSIVFEATLGNLMRTITPSGYTETFTMDGIGRLIRDSTPTDSGPHLRITTFDLVDQATAMTDSVWGLKLKTWMVYDAAGNMDSLFKLSVPDKAGIDTVKQFFVYDRANRKTSEGTVGFASVAYTYDPAGNLLTGGRMPTTNTYDALGRVIKKVADDTATITYDAGGHMTAANNSTARVARTYYSNGALRTDTLRVVTDSIADQDFSTNVYALSYSYDLDGRRVAYGDNMHSATTDTVKYQYDPAAGMLSKVTDIFGHQFTFGYDVDDRLNSLIRFADRSDSLLSEVRRYDMDGRLLSRTDSGKNFAIISDTLSYNKQGKVGHNWANGDSAHYHPMGQLIYGAYQPGGQDKFDYDADGNQDSSVVVGESSQRWSVFFYGKHSNQLDHAVHPFAGFGYSDTTYYSFSQGRQTVNKEVHPFDEVWNCGPTLPCVLHHVESRLSASAFGNDGRLRNVYFRLDTIQPPHINAIHYQSYSYRESYRYDALGRRVWKLILRDADCWNHDSSSGCVSAVTRTVWEGDQVLYEIRTSAGPNPGITGSQFGTVGYLHVGGLDEPIELFKGGVSDILLPYLNWRGNYNIATCPLKICFEATFPSSEQSSYGDFFPQGPTNWYGDVIEGQMDASGLLYRRNRYLDPKAGRFTQEDPIGLAGGLNSYGFAHGDPVTYSDPFGLCPPYDTDPCNMHTGDQILDDPDKRSVLETEYKQSLLRLDGDGVPREVGGSCSPPSPRINCTDNVGIWNAVTYTERPDAEFDFHTHAAEGTFLPKVSKVSGSGLGGISDDDKKKTGPVPEYIVGKTQIFKLTYDAKAKKLSIQVFERWTSPPK